MKILVGLCVGIACLVSLTAVAGWNHGALEERVRHYRQAFQVESPFRLLIDYHGDYQMTSASAQGIRQDDSGLKNVKMALNGVLYWGGGKQFGRDNRNPLQDFALKNLCKEGFNEAVYLYSTNHRSAPQVTSCKNPQWGARGKAGLNRLNYDFIRWDKTSEIRTILEKIYTSIENPQQGPVYVHCWNGLHASNGVAAIALKQFCGWDDEAAAEFWVKNARKGDQHKYRTVQKIVRDFEPWPDLMIPDWAQDLVCPSGL